MFNDSKYTRWYFDIISSARARGYGDEKHHIIPKCMGGGNESSNIVALTYREHFVCHLLLVKMANEPAHIYKLKCAVSYFMTRKLEIGSRRYETARVSRPRMSDETKLKISKANKGRVVSEETREKLRNVVVSEETKEKISQTLKGRKLPEETKVAISKSVRTGLSMGKFKTPYRDSEALRERYFSNDMGEKLAEGRRNSDKWKSAVSSDKSRHLRRLNSPNRKSVTIDGVNYVSIRAAAKELGITYSELRWKLQHPPQQDPQPSSTPHFES